MMMSASQAGQGPSQSPSLLQPLPLSPAGGRHLHFGLLSGVQTASQGLWLGQIACNEGPAVLCRPFHANLYTRKLLILLVLTREQLLLSDAVRTSDFLCFLRNSLYQSATAIIRPPNKQPHNLSAPTVNAFFCCHVNRLVGVQQIQTGLGLRVVGWVQVCSTCFCSPWTRRRPEVCSFLVCVSRQESRFVVQASSFSLAAYSLPSH